MTKRDIKIGVIGLGYVGLPLAVEFSKIYPVTGFDIDTARIEQLRMFVDITKEVPTSVLESLDDLQFSADTASLQSCNVFIVAVPTPIDQNRQPRLTALLSASRLVGSVLKAGDTVIYESTVYPGATEEVCIPELTNESGLRLNTDFFVGYSPERINPGDRERSLVDIVKITSGSSRDAAEFVDTLYKSIVNAGTHKAPSIKVAEAAKVIENTQRDVNIALVNELSMIFERMEIDTQDVLAAAETKWNFMRFNPGLVGGHCIGVDPYYLAHKAQALNYYPEMILAGRRLNDKMGEYAASRFIKALIKKGFNLPKTKVLVLGITFKENCPDIRNTKVTDLIAVLEDHRLDVDIFDPICDKEKVKSEYGLKLITELRDGNYGGVILAVPHKEFLTIGVKRIRDLCLPSGIFFDLKSALDITESDLRL